MATGYEDIDNLTNQQNSMLDESLKQQQDIVNKQTQMNIDALERNKAEVDEQATKTNQGLYSEYKKASNPYGVNAEQLYSKGLGNTGYAETTQTNLYNTYQKNVTDTINNAQKLKSDFDFQMSQARQNGDITLAQNALEIYKQKMQLLTQEYELKNNREQYLYQKEQDALAQNNWEKEFARQQERDQVSDSQWQQSFDYNKSRDQVSDNQWQQTFDYNKSRDDVSDRQYAEQMAYQKERDAVSDSQWAREYELSRSKANSSSENYLNVRDDDVNGDNSEVSETVNKLYTSMSQLLLSNNSNINKETARRIIAGEVNKGTILDEDAKALFDKLNL